MSAPVSLANSHLSASVRWQPLLKIAVLLATFILIGINTAPFNKHFATSVPKLSRNYLQEANNKTFTLFNKCTFLDPRLEARRYTIVPDQPICTNKLFVVVIHVRAEDQWIRNIWRRTYGDYRLKEKLGYSLIFSIGKNYTDEQIQENLTAEARAYGDMLQADYADTYRNLTLKHLAGLRYVVSMCPNVKAVVKLDDDVGWDIEATAKFINETLETEDMFCHRQIGAKAVRTSKVVGLSKWKVTKKEWDRKKFPTYCSGMAYIAALPLIQRLLKVVHLQKFFWVDDIFITGVLTEATNVVVGDLPDIRIHKRERVRKKMYLIDKNDLLYWFLSSNIDLNKIADEALS